jgi:prepilin-type N-terminal cleavage/methylation domain-containing protein
VDQQLTSYKQRGFSLIEVLIAITLFAFFVTAFLTAQGYNVSDSALSEEQLVLQQLCERKINELYLDPPKFQNLTTGGLKETKKFEEKDLSNYEYTLEIKKLSVPDFAQLFGQKDGVSEEGKESYDGDYLNQNNGSQRNAGLEKMVFEELRKNIEKIVWQARVTVTNKETKFSYSLSTWLTNYNEQIQLNVGF